MTVDLASWEPRFADLARAEMAAADAAHDLAHIRRVVASAKALAAREGADLAVVAPAAWLHDCVSVPKDSPIRARASALAADRAVELLRAAGYPEAHLTAIHHAIAAHSFSARIAPATPEARVVQDADRLDALGAIGLARCFTTGGALGRPLYHPDDPFADRREPDDADNSIDHFYCKLLRLADTMTTSAGREEGQARTAFLRQFLQQLRRELGEG